MLYIYDKLGNFKYGVYDLNVDDLNKLKEENIVSTEYIEYPKIEDGALISMSEEEIQAIKYQKYLAKEYELKSNEIIDNEKVIQYQLKDYESIQKGTIVFDYEAKRESLLRKTKIYEQSEKEASFEFKGYMQPNRELEDQTSLLKVISFMQLKKQTSFDSWKMKDTYGHEHYITLTLNEMLQLAFKMEKQTSDAMIKWTKIREHLKSLSNEEIRAITNLKEYVESLEI